MTISSKPSGLPLVTPPGQQPQQPSRPDTKKPTIEAPPPIGRVPPSCGTVPPTLRPGDDKGLPTRPEPESIPEPLPLRSVPLVQDSIGKLHQRSYEQVRSYARHVGELLTLDPRSESGLSQLRLLGLAKALRSHPIHALVVPPDFIVISDTQTVIGLQELAARVASALDSHPRRPSDPAARFDSTPLRRSGLDVRCDAPVAGGRRVAWPWVLLPGVPMAVSRLAHVLNGQDPPAAFSREAMQQDMGWGDVALCDRLTFQTTEEHDTVYQPSFPPLPPEGTTIATATHAELEAYALQLCEFESELLRLVAERDGKGGPQTPDRYLADLARRIGEHPFTRQLGAPPFGLGQKTRWQLYPKIENLRKALLDRGGLGCPTHIPHLAAWLRGPHLFEIHFGRSSGGRPVLERGFLKGCRWTQPLLDAFGKAGVTVETIVAKDEKGRGACGPIDDPATSEERLRLGLRASLLWANDIVRARVALEHMESLVLVKLTGLYQLKQRGGFDEGPMSAEPADFFRDGPLPVIEQQQRNLLDVLAAWTSFATDEGRQLLREFDRIGGSLAITLTAQVERERLRQVLDDMRSALTTVREDLAPATPPPDTQRAPGSTSPTMDQVPDVSSPSSGTGVVTTTIESPVPPPTPGPPTVSGSSKSPAPLRQPVRESKQRRGGPFRAPGTVGDAVQLLCDHGFQFRRWRGDHMQFARHGGEGLRGTGYTIAATSLRTRMPAPHWKKLQDFLAANPPLKPKT